MDDQAAINVISYSCEFLAMTSQSMRWRKKVGADSGEHRGAGGRSLIAGDEQLGEAGDRVLERIRRLD